MRKAKATQEVLEPSAGLMEFEESYALPERPDAAHRNSNIEVQLPGHKQPAVSSQQPAASSK